MNLDKFVEVDPEKMGGTPCIAGTRVPIKNLFDYLETGDSLETFLDEFPTVRREHAQAVLEASRMLESHTLALTESFIRDDVGWALRGRE